MPAEQPLTELTMRDVLLQVDRRLTLIEDDLRTLDQKWDQRFGSLDQKIDSQTNQLRQGNEQQISLDARRRLGQLDFHHRDAVAQVSSPTPQTTPPHPAPPFPAAPRRAGRPYSPLRRRTGRRSRGS